MDGIVFYSKCVEIVRTEQEQRIRVEHEKIGSIVIRLPSNRITEYVPGREYRVEIRLGE